MRRVYTEHDQALVAVTYQTNNGNLRRTARDTGIPVTTIRDWTRKWEAEGYPEPVEAAVPAVRESFLEEAELVRNLMVRRLQEKVQRGEASTRDLITGIGVLTDKINVLRGMATSRTETLQVVLPDTQELAKGLAKFITKTVDDSVRRSEVIEDAEWDELAPRELEASNH